MIDLISSHWSTKLTRQRLVTNNVLSFKERLAGLATEDGDLLLLYRIRYSTNELSGMVATAAKYASEVGNIFASKWSMYIYQGYFKGPACFIWKQNCFLHSKHQKKMGNEKPTTNRLLGLRTGSIFFPFFFARRVKVLTLSPVDGTLSKG